MPRTVLVTGGSGALGQAITRRFLDAGDTVCVPWIVDKERQRLEQSVSGETRARLLLERCDVGDDAAMAQLVTSVVDRSRGLDVLDRRALLVEHQRAACRCVVFTRERNAVGRERIGRRIIN